MTHPTSGERVAVELCEGLPVDELHARLLLCLELQEVGNRGLAFYLADMHDRGLHQTTGHGSTAHFAECRLEISRSQAYQLIKAGRALRDLPTIDDAFARGELSWSKVVLLTRVVTPEHEAAWLERAAGATYRELRLAVRLAKHGSAPREQGDTKGLPEIRYDIRARVDVLTHREIELAREKLSAERGEPIDDAGLLAIAAKLILGSDDNGELPGRERIDGSLYRIVLHANSAPDGAQVTDLALDTRDGPMPLPDADADADAKGDAKEAKDPTSLAVQRECMLCDGACSSGDDLPEGVAPPDVTTPPAMRRRVLARDDHSCRCCGGKHGLMVHHIHFRSRGGRTRMTNLITLCSHCHALVHADLMVLQGDHAKSIVFLDGEGRPLDGRLPRAPRGTQLSRPVRKADPTLADDEAAVPAPREPVPFAEAFEGIVGQDERLARLRWTLVGRRRRGGAFPHTLFCGPPGTGKTTIARALARHAGVAFLEASGPTLASVADVRALLARLPEGGMLFVDEIHAVPRVALEFLYEAMAPSGATISVLGATTDAGDLPAALRSRFGLVESFDIYDVASLAAIAGELGRREDASVDEDAAQLLAEHARGTPRTLVHLTLAALDHAASREPAASRAGTLDVGASEARAALRALGYDGEGFTPLDRRYLETLRAQAGPVALQRLAAMLGVGASTLRDCVEPFLALRGLVSFTPRGRVAATPPRRLASG